MAPRPLTWRSLRPGLLASAVIVALALAVLAFARVGSVRGKTYSFFVATDEATSVMPGTEVWLAGQPAGVVRDVHLRVPPSDTARPVLLHLDVRRDYREQIRRDSRVRVQPSGTMVGAIVVSIEPGTPRAPPLAPGDTVLAREIDPDQFRHDVSRVAEGGAAVIENLKDIIGEIATTRNRVSAIGADRSSGLVVALRHADDLARRANVASGTLARLGEDDPLRTRARRAMARADSMLRAMSSPVGTLGRMGSDTALLVALRDARDELSIVRLQLDRPAGTAGRLTTDSALAVQMRALEVGLGETIAEVKRHPRRYLAF